MKNIIIPALMCCIVIFITKISYSQDIIILKNGDEIKSKVIEVTPDLVKYKKWANQDGPIYSSTKTEIFMIKYANGAKDVFNNTSNANSNSSQTSNSNSSSKFIGTWYPKTYDGNNNKTTLTISKPGDDYLVIYKKMERGGGYDFMYNADGSFKEMGHIEGNSIVINSFIKLSLLNDNTILMASEEFVKSPISQQNQISNNTNTTKTDYIGHYNDSYSIGEYKTIDGILYYKSNSAQITAVTFDVDGVIQNSKMTYLAFKGSQSNNQFLTANIVINGFKKINGNYNYAVSAFTTYNGEEYDKRENMNWDYQIEPLLVKFAYNTPSFKAGATHSFTFYTNFLFKDKNSDAIIQGFFKYTLLP